KPELARALQTCTVIQEDDFYIFCVKAKTYKAVCKLLEPFYLQDLPGGDVIVDLLPDNRVAGIQLISRLLETWT
ncbi:hypothetical protein BVX99_00490, partial [bacterium F16]